MPDKELEIQEEEFLADYNKLARQIKRLRRNVMDEVRIVKERIRILEEQLDETGNN